MPCRTRRRICAAGKRGAAKIEHSRLKVDSIKHPVDLREDTEPYKLDGDWT